MSFYIRHRSMPIKFLQMAGRDVASQVATNMATVFDTREDALDRAHQQFGDTGLEHVEVCEIQSKAKTATPSNQGELL